MRKRSAWLLGALGLFCSGMVQAQSTVLCESRGGGYRECYSGFRYSPQIVEQQSGSLCVEGRTWGHRPGAIWVSNGCRGVFAEADDDGYSDGDDEGIICESAKGRYTECPLLESGPVQLVEQLSSRPCVEGQSWGRDRGKLWVDQGCRARFAQYYGGGGGDEGGYSGGSHWQASSELTSECSSREGRRQICEWHWEAGTPFLVEQLSSSPCVNGRSWGYDRNQSLLWVSQGCRAIFGSR